MRRTTQQMIQDSINEGYVLLSQDTGSYDADLQKYRSEGYDVRAWYVKTSKNDKHYELYGKKKESRRSKKSTTQETNNPPLPVTTVESERSILESHNVKYLTDLCKVGKIKGYGKMNKSQMIEAILNLGVESLLIRLSNNIKSDDNLSNREI